ncbi:hypothetical protein GCM10027019_14760 [Melaminivora jejuensis]|uniref:helix-turn-helix domain-containing protein n=1 Tax=Melaminivora jejuensis TaxID=1267217 RepID=UPI001AE05034|nr:helix-turn-helix transcriptional regulator [Melaminivora jejuensis]UHJ64489.1 helix-turn-helix domain-containing protein [Melaminivora jejuensis]
MTDIQVIQQDGKPAFYVVPADIWDRVRSIIEDADDSAVFDRAVASDDGIRYPSDVAFAIADGASPIRAWREHRQLSQEALARAAGVSKPFISQMESGKRAGTAATLKKIASALCVPVDALL